MDTDQWPQEIGPGKPMEEMVSSCSRPILERRLRPQKEQALNCPRCNSTNTKFCYYNNYSLTQPRYFCKTCRRYWTEGGSLRNVPVGGGSRKNKRSVSKKIPDLTAPNSLDNPSNPSKIQEGQDLNLAFPNSHHNISADHVDLPPIDGNNNSSGNHPSSSAASSSLSALEFLRSGFSSRSLSSYMAVPDCSIYPSMGFGLHDFNRSNFSVPVDGFTGYGNFQETGRVLFPFEDLRQVSNTDLDENRGQADSSGYWKGMLGGDGGGGSWSQVPNYGP